MRNLKFRCPILIPAVLLVLSATACFAQGGWTQLTSPVFVDLVALDFASPTTGTIVGYGATILRTTNGGTDWTSQAGEPEVDYRAVSFADENTGLATANWGTIIRTTNGGTNWTTIQTGWTETYLGALQLTPARGMVVGINGIMSPIIQITTNGWVSYEAYAWYPIHEGAMNEGAARAVAALDDATFVTPVWVWDNQGAITRTTNGGAAWETVYWGPNGLVALEFPTPQVGYAVGLNGAAVKSTDGGASWTELQSGTQSSLWGLSFINADTGWAVGDLGTILRTNDGGQNWTVQPSNLGNHLVDVDFVDANTGYVCGLTGVILKTTTGGEEVNQPPAAFARVSPADNAQLDTLNVHFVWTESNDPDGDAVNYRFRLWSETHPFTRDVVINDTSYAAVISGPVPNGIYTFHWSVVAFDDADSTHASNGEGIFTLDVQAAAEDPGAGLVRDFALSAYPNPFNPATTLSFSLPQSGPASLRVFDVTGREVFTQHFGQLAAGRHELRFDAASLGTGVYFAQLEAGRVRLTTKLLLMK